MIKRPTSHGASDKKLDVHTSDLRSPLERFTTRYGRLTTGLIAVTILSTGVIVPYFLLKSSAIAPTDPTVTTNNGTDTSCVFNKADLPLSVAFCDGFSSPTVNPTGSRSGDLNGTLWGVSHSADWNPGGVLNSVLPSELVGCGATIAAAKPPMDVRICNGRVIEAQDDNHGVVDLTMYPKQPFDFAGRTGTVVFDVSADSGGSHAAWPEFVITDKPNPGVRTDVSAHTPPMAANEIGFALDGGCGSTPGTTGVGQFFMSKNNIYSNPAWTFVDCVQKSAHATGPLNHFEFRISQNRAEVWGGDPGSTTIKLLAYADNLNLGFTKGLVWMNDVHYNARKELEPCECGTQYHHSFAWDNLGFDGPKTYRDLSFDVPNANDGPQSDGRYNEGYQVGNGAVGLTLNTLPVFRYQTPTSALVTFTYYSFADSDIPSISINGHTPITIPWPYAGNLDSTGYYARSLAVTVPVADTIDGVNAITFKANDGSTSVADVNLILVAAAAVPGQVIVPSVTPAPTGAPTPTPTPVPPTPTPTPVQPLAYDLVAQDITWLPSNPQTGQQVTFSAIVKNVGSTATPSSFQLGLRFAVDGDIAGRTWYYNMTQPAIPAGDSVTVTANGPGPNSWQSVGGAHSVELFVDDTLRLCPASQGGNCQGFPVEISTTNNKRTEQIVVSSTTPAPAPAGTITLTYPNHAAPAANAIVSDIRQLAIKPTASAGYSISSVSIVNSLTGVTTAATLDSSGVVTTPNKNGNYTITFTAVSGITSVTSTATVRVRHPDFNRDGRVSTWDLSALFSKWHTNYPEYDINDNGTVDLYDFAYIYSNWGVH